MEGELEQVDGRWQLTFVRRLSHPPEKVWRALTEHEHLDAWFPTGVEGERAAGAKLRFPFPPVHDIPPMVGEMLTYEPPRKLEMSWGEEDTLHFDLAPDGDGTVLTFLNRFDTLGKAARDGAGWHSCLDELTYHLDGRETPWPAGGRWQQVAEGYKERFGPEASELGPPEGYKAGEKAG